MANLLRIDTSARTTGSHSRTLGDRFETVWRAAHPGGTIVRRDLAADPLPHIADATIAGFYTPDDQMIPALRDATALSDALIAELRAADVLLVTVPMYNFTVPSALKAWIDQIVRIGHTFAYDGATFTGLVTGKTAVIAAAYGAGGYLGDGPMADYDLVRPYLERLFGFLGFADIRFAGVEATTAEAATIAANAQAAGDAIARLAVAA